MDSYLIEEFRAGQWRFRIMESKNPHPPMTEMFFVRMRLPSRKWKTLRHTFETEKGAKVFAFHCLCDFLEDPDSGWKYF